MAEKELKIRDFCGDYATVKHIIEVDKSKPNEATVCDMQEIKHGKWEEIRDSYGQLEGWIHIECGREVKIKENYCPYCGAKMDNM